MKIKELKKIFTEITQKMVYKYDEPTQGGQKVSLFSNLNPLRKGFNELESTGLLADEINHIRSSAIFTTSKSTATLNLSEGRKLRTQLDSLIKLVQSLNHSFAQLGGKTDEHSISIKLPEITDFDDLSKTSADLHKILNQAIINDKIKGQVRIDNVENGSIWLDVFLGSSAAVTLIGSLAWASAVIYKKFQEGRIIEEHVKSLKVKTESLKEIQDKQKKSLDLLIQAEAESLYNENFSNGDKEQIERLKLSIKMLTELIDKGAEIHPALNQPENVSNLFPNMKNLQLIESRIKKLAP